MEYSFLVEMVSSWCISPTAQFPSGSNSCCPWPLAGWSPVRFVVCPGHHTVPRFSSTHCVFKKNTPTLPGPPCIFFSFCVFSQKGELGGCKVVTGLRCIHLEFNARIPSMGKVLSGMAFCFVFGFGHGLPAVLSGLLSNSQHKRFPCLSLSGSQGDRCEVLLWDGVFRCYSSGLLTSARSNKEIGLLKT